MEKARRSVLEPYRVKSSVLCQMKFTGFLLGTVCFQYVFVELINITKLAIIFILRIIFYLQFICCAFVRWLNFLCFVLK